MLLIPVMGILSHPVQKAIKKCSMIESYKLGDYRYTVWQENLAEESLENLAN